MTNQSNHSIIFKISPYILLDNKEYRKLRENTNDLQFKEKNKKKSIEE